MSLRDSFFDRLIDPNLNKLSQNEYESEIFKYLDQIEINNDFNNLLDYSNKLINFNGN